MEKFRSFIAIPLPNDIKKSVQDWIEPLRKHDTSIKWVRPEGIHLTLKFLGNVEEERFEREFFLDFKQLLTPFGPIRLNVKNVGQFPPQGIPRVLWIGLGGDTAVVKALALAVDNFFERLGFLREKRDFSPHVTLARVREKPSSGFLKVWKEVKPPPPLEFTADRVVFYKSELTKKGAVYSVIREFLLQQ